MKDMELKRINIRIPAYIQDYYKAQGEKYSVPYTNYIAMVLTQIHEKEEEKQLVQEFNESLKVLNSSTGDVTADEMMKQLKDMQDLITRIDK